MIDKMSHEEKNSYQILSDHGCYWICIGNTNYRFWAGRNLMLAKKIVEDLVHYEADFCHVEDIIEDYLYDYCFCS
ncbi:MAG: hypothetical protein ACOX60_08185 [Massiliimalia sp.]